MSWTPAEIADEVWTHATRTVDGNVPAASDGTPLDNIAYAVWTYPTRTASGGAATFSIQVAQAMPAPSQAGTLQTVMPVLVAQVVPAPAQTIAAEFTGVTFEILVNQSMPAPSQSASAEAQGGAVKPLGAGGPHGFSYYPPIYTIRTKGRQGAPAPSQSGFARYNPKIIEAPRTVEPLKVSYEINGVQFTLAPAQSAVLKSHRSIKSREREEQDIMTLLASL